MPAVPAVPAVLAVLSLGSNLGDRGATLAAAVRDLAAVPGLEVTGVSPVYESAAVKPNGVDDDAPRYLNLAVGIRYRGEPLDLLDATNAIEQGHGRVRAERWGDRTLDIDVIVFGELQTTDARLTLPHPRAAERDFVLVPWLDLDPAAVLPGLGPVRALLAALDAPADRESEAPADEPVGATSGVPLDAPVDAAAADAAADAAPSDGDPR